MIIQIEKRCMNYILLLSTPSMIKLLVLFAQLYFSLQWCLKQTYYELAGSPINQVDWSPDNSYIVVGSESKRVTVISFITSNVVWYDNYTNIVTTCKFGKTGKYLAVGFSGDDTVKIYNVPAFTPLSSWRAQHGNTQTIHELDWSSDDSMLATCATDGYVNQIFRSGSIDWQSPVNTAKDILACKYSDLDRVGLFCDDGFMYLLKSDGTKDQFISKANMKDVDFQAGTSRYLYGANTDKKIYEFDTKPSISIGQYINPNYDQAWAVSTSADGTVMAVGMKNGHFQIVDTSNRGSPALDQYFKDSTAHIRSVRVSADSNYIAVSHEDGVIRIYARRCSTCAYGFYRNSTECRLCSRDVAGCQSCLNSTLCLTCFPNYYLDSTTKLCKICDASTSLKGCYYCKNSTACYVCAQSYYLSGTSCLKCQQTTTHCEECQNNGTCIKCSYRSYLTATNTCSLCKNSITNCIACYLKENSSSLTLSTLYCSQCQQGYYASTTQCLPCSAGCIQCLSDASCVACAQEYKLSGTSCVQCGQYCQSCFQNGTCFECVPTTFLSSGACSPCTFPCLTCTTSATTCRSCAPGYTISGSVCNKCSGCPLCNPFTGACLTCPIGQYLQSPGNTCAFCLNTTSKCQICSATACFACERNYYLTGTGTCEKTATLTDCIIYEKGSTTICQHCNFGLYLDSGTGNCLSCMKGCASCDNPNNCTQCLVGYFMQSTNSTCLSCTSPCLSCNSSSQCLSCGDQYYLSGTSCSKCWDSIPYCHSCLNSTHCLDCYLGYQLASDSLSCPQCVSPCSTCNSSGCLSCEIGFFYSPFSCTRCPGNCTACQSNTVCTACAPGFKLDGSNACVLCSLSFANCLHCSSSACTVCKPYFMLDSTLACIGCSSNITNCLVCNNSGLCSTCNVGYHPDASSLSCIDCSTTMPNCEKCVSSTTCDQCQTGFYLSSTNQCSECIDGCLICSAAGTCDICEPGFILTASNSCIQCSQHIFGCQTCTLSAGCSDCLLGYYRSSSTSCLLCKSAMEGCISCTSSTVCKSCDAGYFVNGTNKCQKCSTSPGCSICNQVTAVCSQCLAGYYLDSSSQCALCSSLYADCALCNQTQCLRCESGTYLNSGSCRRCTLAYSQGCILCSQTACLQCESGYYLDSSGNCQICSITGCEICSPNGLTCLSCQNLYYKTGTTCSTCESMNFGCLSCNGLNSCILCKTGYYLETNGTCVLCESKFTACDVCSFSRCSVCETNYFYNSTSPAGNCLLCNRFMPGCSLCLNEVSCLLCESGYYLQNLQCNSCTVINQCLICKDNTTCLFCGAGYYLKNGQCLSCSAAILGCFSCVSENICTTCSGSYVMSVGACIEAKGVIPQNYTNIRIVSEYINETHLKHTLLTTGASFRQIQQKWNEVTKIQLILPPNNRTTLNILKVQWGQKNLLSAIIFFTNNPLGSLSSSNATQLPLVKFTRRALLTLEQLNMQINFAMKQSTINEILPELDTNGQDLGLEYKLDNPEFYKSIVKEQKHFYYLFGIAVVIILLFAYLIKICFLIPMTNDSGQIIPHVLLLKLPAMVIYPTLGGYINFCYGFTYLDFPWLNDYFSYVLSNLSDKAPNSFLMFYNNLNLGSTYMLALMVFIGVMLPLKIISVYRNYKKGSISKMIDTKATGFSKNISVMEKSSDRIEIFMGYFYNVFIAGLTVASFSGIIGMTYNPTGIVSGPGALYILCVLIYTLIWIDGIKSFGDSKGSFNKVRVIIKASLMTLIFWSPVPLFSSMVVIDVVLMAYEYKIKLKEWVVPKVWLLSHSLLLVSFGALIFLNNMLVGIIITFICVTVVLGCDIFLLYREHLQIEKIKDMREKSKQYTENNLSIEGFIPDRKDLMESQIQDLEPKKQKNQQISRGYERSARIENLKQESKLAFGSTLVSNSMNLSKMSYANQARETFNLKDIRK